MIIQPKNSGIHTKIKHFNYIQIGEEHA